ncbi:hypothetical protein GCM10010218_44940 [Streptomyces mashuensis]|uniref:DUF6875 domain-containing protein n=1 Tax=Streptomyces mashuensis TaxID=33904 RepID=A0A919B695_9ACTN|nr:hypothetical protein [Streptomyces mashuensis]GHF58635.1 hypothetical protein GCM10010218_44940 [Streptomyces mashuensis]
MMVRHGPAAPGPPPAEVLGTARQWFAEYVTRPHDRLGRPGPVCPFVEPSLKAGSLELRAWDVAPDTGVAGMVDVVRRMTEAFDAMAWTGHNPALHALVVVVRGLAPERFGILDAAHAEAKTPLARRGLMLGQFHPHCPEPAARNPRFPVSLCPVPLLALRRMAFHDVLFLHGHPAWFAAYRERYGDRYDQGTVPDPFFVRLFAQARQAWGDDPRPPGPCAGTDR